LLGPAARRGTAAGVREGALPAARGGGAGVPHDGAVGALPAAVLLRPRAPGVGGHRGLELSRDGRAPLATPPGAARSPPARDRPRGRRGAADARAGAVHAAALASHARRPHAVESP